MHNMGYRYVNYLYTIAIGNKFDRRIQRKERNNATKMLNLNAMLDMPISGYSLTDAMP